MVTKPDDSNGPLLDRTILNQRIVMPFNFLVRKDLILILACIFLFRLSLFLALLIILDIHEAIQFEEEKEWDFFEVL